jgi:hypothetical protein
VARSRRGGRAHAARRGSRRRRWASGYTAPKKHHTRYSIIMEAVLDALKPLLDPERAQLKG